MLAFFLVNRYKQLEQFSITNNRYQGNNHSTHMQLKSPVGSNNYLRQKIVKDLECIWDCFYLKRF